MNPVGPVILHKFDLITALMTREFVPQFSEIILGTSYDDLKKIVYPHPRYRTFVITKRNGSPRTIHEPRQALKRVQRQILMHLESQVGPPRQCVQGFVQGRSVVTNAFQHCSPKVKHILNVDLADFFPSITFKRVRGALRKHPFFFSHSVASLIAHICTLDGKLPQGAPTSPFFANLICRGLDRELTDLARRCRATYTRYADDITFSFQHPYKEKLPASICVWEHGSVQPGEDLRNLIDKHGFSLNDKKTRLGDRFSRMEVTGLTVNHQPNVRREFVDRIRGGLHAWEKFGYKAAQDEWHAKIARSSLRLPKDRCWRRQTRLNEPPALKNLLWGRLLYLRMVRGKSDLLYTRLAEKFNFLCEYERLTAPFPGPLLPLEPIAQNRLTAEDAVFVVKWNGIVGDIPVGGEGTAFVYSKLNLLVTCDHVFESSYEVQSGFQFNCEYLDDDVIGKSIVLVRPRSNEEFSAKIIHRSKQLDLAVLAFCGPSPLHTYFPKTSDPVQVGDPGILIGFPAYIKGNRPDFLPESVLNKLEPSKGRKIITITGAGAIRPGNSGGPFVDLRFKVLGVAQQGAYNGVGHDTCLDASILDNWLQCWADKGAPSLEPLLTTVTIEAKPSIISPQNLTSSNYTADSALATNTSTTSVLASSTTDVIGIFKRTVKCIIRMFRKSN